MTNQAIEDLVTRMAWASRFYDIIDPVLPRGMADYDWRAMVAAWDDEGLPVEDAILRGLELSIDAQASSAAAASHCHDGEVTRSSGVTRHDGGVTRHDGGVTRHDGEVTRSSGGSHSASGGGSSDVPWGGEGCSAHVDGVDGVDRPNAARPLHPSHPFHSSHVDLAAVPIDAYCSTRGGGSGDEDWGWLYGPTGPEIGRAAGRERVYGDV